MPLMRTARLDLEQQQELDRARIAGRSQTSQTPLSVPTKTTNPRGDYNKTRFRNIPEDVILDIPGDVQPEPLRYQGDEYENYMNDPDRMTQKETLDMLYQPPKPFIQQRGEFDPDDPTAWQPFQINFDVPLGKFGAAVQDVLGNVADSYNEWWDTSIFSMPMDEIKDYISSGDYWEDVSEKRDKQLWENELAQEERRVGRLEEKFPHIPEDTLAEMYEEFGMAGGILWQAPYKQAEEYYKEVNPNAIVDDQAKDIAAGRTEANKYLKDYTYYLEEPPYLPTSDFFPDISIEGAEGMSLQEGISAGFSELYQEYGGERSFQEYENADVLYLEFFKKNEMWDELARAGGMDYTLELGANWMSEASGLDVGVNDAGQIVAPEDFDITQYLDDDDLDLMEGLGWIDKPPQGSVFGGGGYYGPRYGGGGVMQPRSVRPQLVRRGRRGPLRLTSWRI